MHLREELAEWHISATICSKEDVQLGRTNSNQVQQSEKEQSIYRKVQESNVQQMPPGAQKSCIQETT